jgi:hypothetical protein
MNNRLCCDDNLQALREEIRDETVDLFYLESGQRCPVVRILTGLQV